MSVDESEDICAKLYSEYLSEKSIDHSVTKGNDPPDYIFEYENTKVAVEVNRLIDYFEDSEGVREVNTPLHSLVNICSHAKELLGSELKINVDVYVTPPLKEEKRLLEEIVQFAEKNYEGRKNLLNRNDCYIISKKGNPEINPWLLRPQNEEKSTTILNDPNVLDKITYSIENRLNAKIRILENLSNFDERILIIYNEHVLGDLINIQLAINNFLPLPRFINRMFLVKENKIFELNINN